MLLILPSFFYDRILRLPIKPSLPFIIVSKDVEFTKYPLTAPLCDTLILKLFRASEPPPSIGVALTMSIQSPTHSKLFMFI